jgi:hypothetical protein
MAGAIEGFQDMMMGDVTSNGQIATPKELEDFVARVSAEIVRLAASGTTQPEVQARITALTNMKSSVQTVIDQVNTGALMSTDIPIMKKDIESAFPILGNLSQPLPQIIKNAGLPPALANLLPENVQNDPNVTREINKLVDKYADTVVNGLSASFAVKYTSPREAEKALTMKSTLCQTGFPSQADLDNVTNAKFQPAAHTEMVTDPLAAKPTEEGRGPAKFDWKKRAKDIEGQIRARGLHPKDFGVMDSTMKVSNDFSWKGYAYMMCTRLQTTMDPSLPETCGCPPMSWPGWNYSK